MTVCMMAYSSTILELLITCCGTKHRATPSPNGLPRRNGLADLLLNGRIALFQQSGILNKEVQVENEKIGVPTVTVPAEKVYKRRKHRAHESDILNPLAVTVAKDTSAPTEGAIVLELFSA